MFIKHIKYIQKNKAKGKLKKIYKHIGLNFGKLAEPLVLHSLNVGLTAGIWAMLFEAVLIEGKIKRSLKEAISTSVLKREVEKEFPNAKNFVWPPKPEED